MLRGDFPTGREFFYLSYMLILAALSLVGLPAKCVMYVHFFVAIIAIICSYRLAKGVMKNEYMALFAPLFYIMWYKFQQWNLIVYTDALFAHMVIVSIYFFQKARREVEIVGVVTLILFTSLLRPTGLGLLLASGVYLCYKFWELNFRFRRILWVIGGGCALLLLNWMLGPFIGSFIKSYEGAEIIYPGISLFMHPSTSLNIPAESHYPLVQLVLFIFHNPIYFLKISALKGALFIGHIKPYYSWVHNLFIIAFLYPIYLLAIRGFLAMKCSLLKVVMASFILFQILTISVTSENWDGRFLLPILPLVFLLAAIGITTIYENRMPQPNTLKE